MEDTVWVKALSTEQLEPLPDLQGRWHRWVSPTKANGGLIFGMGELQPGDVAGWHDHPESEVFFVLAGHGEARWREGDEEHRAEIHPGMAFYKVGGVPHQMVNLGDGPLIGLAFKVAAV